MSRQRSFITCGCILALLTLVAACGGSSGGPFIGEPTAAPSGGSTSVSVGANGASLTLPATSGITPTITVPAGATTSTFTLSASTTTASLLPQSTATALALTSPVLGITLTASGGPSALARDLTISIPASQIGTGKIAVVAVPDGKTGNAAFHRLVKMRADGSSSSTTEIPWANFSNGALVVTDPYGTYTGSFQVFVINQSVQGEDCTNVGGIGSLCAGAVLGYPFTGNDSYELLLSELFYNSMQTDAVGAMGAPSCSTGTMGTPEPNPPGGTDEDGYVEYDTHLSGNLSNGQMVCDLAIPQSIDTSSGNLAFVAFASLQLPGLPTPTPSPSPSPTASPLAFYRAQFSTGNPSLGTWPATPGIGPVNAIAAQINVNSQPFIYVTDAALGSQTGTITVTPQSTGSASFCTASNFSYFAATNTGSNSTTTSSFMYPFDALQITLPAFQFGTDSGTCFLQFSDGSKSATIPELVNPLTSASFTGGIPQVPQSGATFALAVNTGAYTSAKLTAPSALSVASTDYAIADLTAGITAGALGVPACNGSTFGVPVSISGSGTNYTLSVGPHSAATNNAFCMVYITDGVIGSPIDLIMDLTP